MEEKNNKLAEMNEVFNNKTLTYRINGFAKACGMNNLKTDVKRLSNSVLFYRNENKGNTQEDPSYYIALNPTTKDEGLSISGYYGNINFVFDNYFNEDMDLDSDVLDLPYSISIYKTFDNKEKVMTPETVLYSTKDSEKLSVRYYTFHLTIEKLDNVTIFVIEKYQEGKSNTLFSKIAFCNDNTEFSETLKLIKAFIYNPELVYITYGEVMKNKIVSFTNDEIDSAIMQDYSLDKPVVKVK